MTHAYNELYLSDAKKSLATMFDYAVNDCKYKIELLVELFLKSGYAKKFETGNPGVVSGMSGVELTRNIVYAVYKEDIVIYRNNTVMTAVNYICLSVDKLS